MSDRTLAAIQGIMGLIEDLFFPIGQGPETGIVDFVEYTIDLRSNIPGSSDVDLETIRCRRDCLAAEPLRYLDLRSNICELSSPVVNVAKIQPAGEHAAEVGGVCDILIPRQFLKKESEYRDTQEDERKVFWLYGDRYDEEEEKCDRLVRIEAGKNRQQGEYRGRTAKQYAACMSETHSEPGQSADNNGSYVEADKSCGSEDREQFTPEKEGHEQVDQEMQRSRVKETVGHQTPDETVRHRDLRKRENVFDKRAFEPDPENGLHHECDDRDADDPRQDRNFPATKVAPHIWAIVDH